MPNGRTCHCKGGGVVLHPCETNHLEAENAPDPLLFTHHERNPRRSLDCQPPADVAGGYDPSGKLGDILLVADGFKVLRRLEEIVHEEQIRAGHIPMLMPTIQPADLWRESGRYDDYGKEMLRITDRHGREMLYGPTNEELITDIFRNSVNSYKELPKTLYHIQWKFRDEVRPPFRRHARTRVLYERRLQLRSGRGGRIAFV